MSKSILVQHFDGMRDKLEKVAYNGDLSRIERAKQQLTIAVAENQRLAACSPLSLVMCARDALELGLDLSKKLGQAYVVPYGSEAQLIIGYRGMVELAGRAGITIAAGIVHEKDEFVWEVGTSPKCIHSPGWKDRGDPIGAFAVATLPDHRTLQERMDKDQINTIRNRSKSGNSGPWVTDPAEMWRKTVIRRLFKTLPTTTNLLARAAEIDSDELVDTTATERPQGSRTDQAKARLGMKVEEPAQETEQPETATEWDDSIPF
jgi:recombination protein RecT